jgi:hypothetical protein
VKQVAIIIFPREQVGVVRVVSERVDQGFLAVVGHP